MLCFVISQINLTCLRCSYWGWPGSRRFPSTTPRNSSKLEGGRGGGEGGGGRGGEVSTIGSLLPKSRARRSRKRLIDEIQPRLRLNLGFDFSSTAAGARLSFFEASLPPDSGADADSDSDADADAPFPPNPTSFKLCLSSQLIALV